jgi:hypothetical protein
LEKDLEAPPSGPTEITLDEVITAPIPPRAAKLLQQMPINVDLVRLWAKVIRTDGDEVVASGEVRLVSGQTELLASEIRLDPKTGRAMAVGRAVLRDRGSVVVCDGLVVDLAASGAEAGPVLVALYGKGADAAAAAHLAAHGNEPSSKGRRFVASGDWLGGTINTRDETASILSVSDAWATPCACSEELPPTWAVRVGQITVRPGAHAVLENAVFELFGIPVAWLPVALIPLGDRRTGILPPTVQFRDGVWLNLPVYLTLGRSADATLSPGVVLQAVDEGGIPFPWVGPRAEGELRWAPARSHSGEMGIVYQMDENFSRRSDSGGNPHRVGGRIQHKGDFGEKGRVNADLRLVSDRRVPANLGADLGARVQPYLRSAGQVSQSFKRFGVGAGMAVFQDLRQERLHLVGEDLAIRAQDLGHVEGRMVPWPILGWPILLSGNANLDNALALGAHADRPLQRDVGQRASLSMGLETGASSRFFSTRLLSRWRQAHLLDDLQGNTRHLFLGLFAGEVRSRVEGPLPATGDAIVHQAEGRAWAAAVPWVGGDDLAFDQEDRWRPGQEVAAGLFQNLTMRGQTQPFFQNRAVVGTDPLDPFSPTWLFSQDLGHRGTRMRLFGSGDLVAPSLDLFEAAVAFPLAPHIQGRAKYWRLSAKRPRILYAHADESLAGWSIPIPDDAEARDALDGRIVWRAGGGLSIAYEGTVELGQAVDRFNLLTHGGRVTWEAPCECMTLSTRVRFWPGRAFPEFRFQLALSALGESVRLF